MITQDLKKVVENYGLAIDTPKKRFIHKYSETVKCLDLVYKTNTKSFGLYMD